METIGSINALILAGAGLILIGIASSRLAMRFGAPLLLVFLGLGMLAGVDGPGGVRFADVETAYLIGSVALAIILFDGGLRTRLEAVQTVFLPAALLASVGVVATGAVVAAAAYFLVGLDFMSSLLMGAIVSSTDAAAVFFLLKQGGLQLKRRIARVLEIESGANDPIAIFAVITLSMLIVARGEADWVTAGINLILQGIVGLGGGVAGGFAIAWAVNRLSLPSGLHPLFVSAAALTLFGLVSSIGGSGFFAAYVAGLVVGNRRLRAQQEINAFHDAATWLGQIAMFLVLGLLVRPSRILDFLEPALIIALVLTFLARPLAVWLCLAPFSFSVREKAFLSWVGLRGAVAIFLASIPWLENLPNAGFFFNVTFFIVIFSLIIQGWTVRPSARWLGISLPDAPATPKRVELDLPGQMEVELAGYYVDEQIARALKRRLPGWARLAMVVRQGRILLPHEVIEALPGDTVYLFVPPDRIQILDRILSPDGEETMRAALAFVLPADQPVKWLGEEYGLGIAALAEDQTIAEWIDDNLECAAYEGATITLEGARLQVRKMVGLTVTQVALILGDEEPLRPPRWQRLWRRAAR